eukprot:5900076-Heterocapsa_arctica.AAC.1
MAMVEGMGDDADSSNPSGPSGSGRAPALVDVPVVALDETPGPTTGLPPNPDDDGGDDGGGDDDGDGEDDPTPDADPYADPRVKKCTNRDALRALLNQQVLQVVLLKGCPNCGVMTLHNNIGANCACGVAVNQIRCRRHHEDVQTLL